MSSNLYCYSNKTKPPKNSIQRLNFTIKPNNTRDYGSRGSMDNVIRRRVYDKTSCQDCTNSSGKCVYPRILGTRAAKGNLQNGSKNGQSGQATYWKSIVPR